MPTLLSSLRGRIVLAAAASALVVLAGVGGLVLASTRRDETIALDGRLQRRAQALARPAALGRLERRIQTGASDASIAGAFPDTGVRVIVAGTVTNQVGALLPDTVRAPRVAGLRTFRVNGARWRAATVRARGGRPRTLVEVAAPLATVEGTVQRLRRRLLLVGLVGLLVAIGLASVAARYASRALARLRETTEAVAGTGQLDMRVPEDGPEEVRTVARALNRMLDRLEASAAERERALDATRRFAADAGHELRTPLAVLQAGLETLDRNPNLPIAARQEIVADALAEHQRLSHLVTALQALTRGDGGPMGDERLVDLAEIVSASATSVRREHDGVEVVIDAPSPLPLIHASPTGLRLLVDNLLQNAARHGTSPGGAPARILVTIAATTTDLALVIEDHGPGVPAHERSRLLERFVRGATARGEGSGLGLAIAAQQAERAGGALELGDRPGGGARFAARIPIGASERGA